MVSATGKFEKTAAPAARKALPFPLIPAAFFLVEVFAFFVLSSGSGLARLWPLVFGALWAGGLSCLIRLLPVRAGRIVFGLLYFLL